VDSGVAGSRRLAGKQHHVEHALLALENVSGAWVQPISNMLSEPAMPRAWDVSYAVAQAYARGEPLRLILYSADSDYHSSKYFVSSDTGDWNVESWPRLDVWWWLKLALRARALSALQDAFMARGGTLGREMLPLLNSASFERYNRVLDETACSRE
jgi:hypothetical protein